jgi:NADH-quinone oxidoreductase subunit C
MWKIKNIDNNKLRQISNIFFKTIHFQIAKALLKIFPKLIIKIKGFSFVFKIQKKYIIIYSKILKTNSNFLFNTLVDIAVIDYPWKKNRFYINYILRSDVYSKIIFICIKTNLKQNIYSMTNLFYSAAWIERECWDFFGIFFLLHKNLKRILTDYGFKGNPLRKDFPLMGYRELFFNSLSKYLSYRSLVN